MARTKGMLNLSGNLEVNAGAPLDARTVVPTVADLTIASNFQYKYVGMPVVVQATGDLYILTANDVTDIANWKKAGISDFDLLSNRPTKEVTPMTDVIDPLPSNQTKYPQYSTSEQRVSTWIDGKPIYQRTFTTVLPDTNADGVVASAYISNSVIPNIDIITSIEGVQSSTDGVYFGNVFYVDKLATVDNTLNLCNINILYNKSNGIYVGNSIYRYNGRNVTVTIQYTKTTD